MCVFVLFCVFFKRGEVKISNDFLKGLGSIRPIFGLTISENIKVCIIFEFLLTL